MRPETCGLQHVGVSERQPVDLQVSRKARTTTGMRPQHTTPAAPPLFRVLGFSLTQSPPDTPDHRHAR